MCLLRLLSTNPNFGYVIKKNPASVMPMQVRSIRRGVAFGFYKKNTINEYIVYFQDAQNEISYKEHHNQEFEYLNKLRYNSPIFVLNALTEFFKATYVTNNNYDIDLAYTNTFIVNLVQIDMTAKKIITKFNLYFPDLNIHVKEMAAESYEITITTTKNLYYLLNFVNVYFGLISIINTNDLDFNDGTVSRLINSLNVVNAPYYVRYLISSRVIVSNKIFQKYKNLLEAKDMILNFGNTNYQRRSFIRNKINFDKPIIDIGCGEGFYAIPFSKNLAKNDESLSYYAVDIDENILEKLKYKLNKQDICKNIIFHKSVECLLEELDNNFHYDVIITEVIEHMDKDESLLLLMNVINNINFSKIIITTPNKDFNKNYILDNQFRHDDHKFELTGTEFMEYIKELNLPDKYKLEYIGVGDIVNNEACSHALIITN